MLAWLNRHSLFIMLVVAQLLFGCDSVGGEKTATRPAVDGEISTPDEPPLVRLNWIGHWKGEDRCEELLRNLKEEFEFTHPGVKINLVFNVDLPGDSPDHKKKAAEEIIWMIKTGTLDWDIVFLDIAVFEYISEKLGNTDWLRENFVDFATVPGFMVAHKEVITEDPFYTTRFGGIMPGPFIEGYIQNIWFNAAVAAKIGVTVKQEDMTFADFLGYAKALAEYNRQHGTAMSLLHTSSFNRLDTFFETWFKSLFDSYEAAIEPIYSERKALAFLHTLQAFEELAQYQPLLNPGWAGLSMDEMTRRFLYDDDGLFLVAGSSMYNRFRGVNPQLLEEKIRPAEPPVLGRANGLIGEFTPVFAVMKKSRNAAIAVDFLMSWTSSATAEKWVRFTKNPTGIRGNLADRGIEQGNIFEKFIVDMQNKYQDKPMRYLRTPTYVFGPDNLVTISELRQKLAMILEGKLTARHYYDEVMVRHQAAVAGHH